MKILKAIGRAFCSHDKIQVIKSSGKRMVYCFNCGKVVLLILQVGGRDLTEDIEEML